MFRTTVVCSPAIAFRDPGILTTMWNIVAVIGGRERVAEGIHIPGVQGLLLSEREQHATAEQRPACTPTASNNLDHV